MYIRDKETLAVKLVDVGLKDLPKRLKSEEDNILIRIDDKKGLTYVRHLVYSLRHYLKMEQIYMVKVTHEDDLLLTLKKSRYSAVAGRKLTQEEVQSIMPDEEAKKSEEDIWNILNMDQG